MSQVTHCDYCGEEINDGEARTVHVYVLDSYTKPDGKIVKFRRLHRENDACPQCLVNARENKYSLVKVLTTRNGQWVTIRRAELSIVEPEDSYISYRLRQKYITRHQRRHAKKPKATANAL